MKKILIAFPFVFAPLVSSCPTNQLYDSFQSSARNKCYNMPEPDRSTCLSRNRDDYETYKKKREQAAGDMK